ncbi:MAG: arsenate reductase ArsC [Bacteroidaceae bacterium]|nr:arsenate reductase ArsC [Bacteroidaceae bacterium]
MKVLILCTGNSCRSQMAHGFLQSFDKSMEVHSAGTQPASQVNLRAVEVMNETGIDISLHTPKSVNIYLDEAWDYVITVCGGANETCPMFQGKVGKRMHIGFDDPSEVQGSEEFVMNEFRRIRDEVRKRFAEFYITEILKKEMPKCSCGGKC